MNQIRRLAAVALLIAAAAASTSGPIDAAPPRQQLTPMPEDTPVVDPDPESGPLYLPLALDGLDRTEPPPLVPEARGYVASLTRSGREACAPATHVLLSSPEGSPGNTAVAVAYASPDEPAINLDLYVTDFVVAGGTEDVAPAACREVTRRLLEVRSIRSIPMPPGGRSAGSQSTVGNRTSTAIE